MLVKLSTFWRREVKVSPVSSERKVPFSLALVFRKRWSFWHSFSKKEPISMYSCLSHSDQSGEMPIST